MLRPFALALIVTSLHAATLGGASAEIAAPHRFDAPACLHDLTSADKAPADLTLAEIPAVPDSSAFDGSAACDAMSGDLQACRARAASQSRSAATKALHVCLARPRAAG